MIAPPIRIVVVAYHSPGSLQRCLSALGDVAQNAVVVDNSSSAAVRDVVKASGGGYVDAGENKGFAAGVNIALKPILAAGDSDVLLLNPDAVLQADDVRRLALYLRRPGNERVAAVAPRLRHSDGAEQRVSWPFPTPLRAWIEAVGLGRLHSRAEFVIGAAVLLRREALAEVGLFDERFFLYAEEADWQRRALLHGWWSSECRDVVGEHVGAGSSHDDVRRETLFHAGQETYIRKWYGRPGWAFYRAAVVAGASLRAVVLRGERRSVARRRAVLYATGPRRRADFVASS